MSPLEQTTTDGPHVDDDTLALVALGEPADPDDAAHIDSCAQCRGEIDSFARVVMTGHALDPVEDAVVTPPPVVWERIALELGIAPAAAAERTPYPQVVGRPVAATATEIAPEAQVVQLGDRARLRDEAAQAPQRSSARSSMLIAASVVGALLGIGVTLGWQAVSDDDPALVATAPMEPLPGKVGEGQARLVGTGPARELTMSLDVDAAPGTYLQVWLLSPDATRMVPVGVIENGDGFWRVPEELDLSQFPIVDVSVEPFDGDSAHSGDSLVRGSLSDV